MHISPSSNALHHRVDSENKPFVQALEEFLFEVKRKEDTRTPFYQKVLSQLESSSLEDDPKWRVRCAEDLEAFVEDLEHKRRHGSKTFSILQRLKPLFSGLSLYTKSCDVAIQAGGAPACVLYGGARLVLDLAQNFYEAFDSVADILGDVGTLLQCYDRFSEVYSSSEFMQQLLVKSYKNIILFWQKASRLLSRNGNLMATQL